MESGYGEWLWRVGKSNPCKVGLPLITTKLTTADSMRRKSESFGPTVGLQFAKVWSVLTILPNFTQSRGNSYHMPDVDHAAFYEL
jgi:hypothetical protein